MRTQLDRAAVRGQCSIAMGDTETLDISEMTFEDALGALEEVVRQLESGEVPLDDSIALYERGEKLRAALSGAAGCSAGAD